MRLPSLCTSLVHSQGNPLFSYKTQAGAQQKVCAADLGELQEAVASESPGYLFCMDYGILTLTPSGWPIVTDEWAAQPDASPLALDVKYTLASPGARAAVPLHA